MQGAVEWPWSRASLGTGTSDVLDDRDPRAGWATPRRNEKRSNGPLSGPRTPTRRRARRGMKPGPRGSATDPEVEQLTELVYRRRRELYDAIDRLKAAEGKERRIKSRLMYVLLAERRRYLSGTVDEEFEELLAAVREAYSDTLPGARVSVVTERPGEVDLRGDATWRALERLYSGTVRRWVEIRSEVDSPEAGRMARQISYYAGGHTPRTFVDHVR